MPSPAAEAAEAAGETAAETIQETETEPVKEVQNSDVWDYPEYVAILREYLDGERGGLGLVLFLDEEHGDGFAYCFADKNGDSVPELYVAGLMKDQGYYLAQGIYTGDSKAVTVWERAGSLETSVECFGRDMALIRAEMDESGVSMYRERIGSRNTMETQQQIRANITGDVQTLYVDGKEISGEEEQERFLKEFEQWMLPEAGTWERLTEEAFRAHGAEASAP